MYPIDRLTRYRTLVTTTISEEGLDITTCNVIISFEEIDHLRGFIQRRGRARVEGSHFYVLGTNNKLEYYQEQERVMNEILSTQKTNEFEETVKAYADIYNQLPQ